MKLKQTRCPNCNASIKLKDDKEENITCEFCGSNFTYVPGKEEVEYKRVEAERAKHTAEEYRAKKEYEEAKKNNEEANSPFAKIFMIVFIFIFAGVMLIFILNLIFAASMVQEGTKQDNESNEKVDSNIFNMDFEMVTNISNGFFVKNALNKIINSNNKYKNHIIKVTYNDITSSKKDKIEEIIELIDESKEYQVNLNYDEAGFVNEFIINDK